MSVGVELHGSTTKFTNPDATGNGEVRAPYNLFVLNDFLFVSLPVDSALFTLRPEVETRIVTHI